MIAATSRSLIRAAFPAAKSRFCHRRCSGMLPIVMLHCYLHIILQRPAGRVARNERGRVARNERGGDGGVRCPDFRKPSPAAARPTLPEGG